MQGMSGEPEIRQRRLRELMELFGATLGPALEAFGRSFAERLLEDESLCAQIRERFEEGSAQGHFPALSEFLLSGASEEERREFFRTGWLLAALRPLGPLHHDERPTQRRR
jgi:hypothetical protein